MKVTIIGLGLMGGSAAIDLKRRGFATEVIGVDNDRLHCNLAQQIGFVDSILPLEEAINKTDFIIVSVPVDACVQLLPKVLDVVENQTVTDFCSTKYNIVEAVKNHPKRQNYVPSHPMAGTEYSGPTAAVPNLFDGKCAIICDTHISNKTAIETVKTMYDTLNMPCVEMESAKHDEHTAYVSHISHISSFALALTVLEKEKDEKNIFNLASGGFASTVRLAKSSPDMWSPIFQHNQKNILTVLETYIEKLNQFKSGIKNKDNKEIHNLIDKSNKIKRILN